MVAAIWGHPEKPPDPQVAVGPHHIVEMVNIVGRVFDKQGAIVQTFRLADLFGVPPNPFIESDPRIFYDALSNRWFAAYGSLAIAPSIEGQLHLAVSLTSDPTGGWAVYHLPFANEGPDNPGIGVTNDKVTASVNQFDVPAILGQPPTPGCQQGYCGEQTIVLQKSDLIAGLPAGDVGMFSFPPHLDRFTVRPVQSLSSVSDQYLTSFNPTSLTVIQVTGTPAAGNVTEAAATSLTITADNAPPPSRTAGAEDCMIMGLLSNNDLGPPPCIDSGARGSASQPIWRDNRLWSAASAACSDPLDGEPLSCAHLVEVQTAGVPSVTQDILYGASGQYYSYPAVTSDSSGNLFVSLTHTNAGIFAEARIAGRLASDPPDTLGGSELLRAGEVVKTSGRWGDLLGAAVDPSQTSCVWLIGEYAKNIGGNDWGTYLGAASLGSGCVSQPGPTPTPTASRYGDVNCDGHVDSIDALLLLQYAAALVSPLQCPLNGDVNNDVSINALDAVLVLQYVAGLIGQLPP